MSRIATIYVRRGEHDDDIFVVLCAVEHRVNETSATRCDDMSDEHDNVLFDNRGYVVLGVGTRDLRV